MFETYDGFESAISGAPLANATAPQDTPTYEDSGQVVHPDIVYFANGWNGYRYWLVMEPYPFSQDNYANPSILVSNDGASWAPPPGITNPIALPNTSYLADADLVYDQASNQMWMYYPHQTVNGQTRMIRKTSSDGINWGDPYNEPLLFTVPDYQLLSPAVVKVGSTYRMWSVNTGAQGCDGQSNYVQVRTSTNGTSWSAPSNVSLSVPNILPVAHRRDLCAFQGRILGAGAGLCAGQRLYEHRALLRQEQRRHQLDDIFDPCTAEGRELGQRPDLPLHPHI